MIAQQYAGYDIYRNILTKTWYAIPTGDITTEHKITAATAAELKTKIDAVAAFQPDPWELPSQPHQLQQVA
jgi:hypothetical protein